MSANSITTEEENKEVIADDVSNTTVSKEDSVDLSKLAALKAKSQAKETEKKMASKIVAKKERSLVLGIIGSG